MNLCWKKDNGEVSENIPAFEDSSVLANQDDGPDVPFYI